MSSWASFKPFAGKLDPSVLRLLLDSQNKQDYKATNLYSAQWIYGLRGPPEDYGIQKTSVQDVIKILNVFFPEPAQNQSIEPLRIRADPAFLHSQAGIAPVSVNLGPANGTVLISDATNALAYIFSIVTPSVSGPTIDNYYLPLTICYACVLYLLFLFLPSSSTPVLTNVPSEACVLYLPSSSMQSSSPSPVFCLGATRSGADSADALASGML